MNLYVWGLPFEGFRMIGASRLDDEILVQIEHQSEPNLFGCMTIDTNRRLVTSLDTRVETLRYENILLINS